MWLGTSPYKCGWSRDSLPDLLPPLLLGLTDDDAELAQLCTTLLASVAVAIVDIRGVRHSSLSHTCSPPCFA